MKKFKRTANVGHILSTSWSPFYVYYMSFRRSGSHKSNSLNGVQIRAETKKLWLFEDNCTKLRNALLAHERHFTAPHSHFAATKWPAKMPLGCEIEPRCEITSKLRIKLQIISKLRNHLQVAESPPSCKTKVQT